MSIIILNWNGLADTAECLDSLRAIIYPNYEVLVVDNGSEASDIDALRERFGNYVRVIENEQNLGFAGGCNVGIGEALSRSADYVLLLNNDTVVAPEFLGEMVNTFEGAQDAACACPKLMYYDRPSVIQSTGGRVRAWTGTAPLVGRGEVDRGQFDTAERRDYCDGACMLIKREAIEQIGLLDEAYFMYWEEIDWCARARRAGMTCWYAPSAKVWHKGAQSAPTKDYYLFMQRRNSLLFLRKRGMWPQLISTVTLLFLFFGPRYFVRHPSRIKRAFVEAKAMIWHAFNPKTGSSGSRPSGPAQPGKDAARSP